MSNMKQLLFTFQSFCLFFKVIITKYSRFLATRGEGESVQSGFHPSLRRPNGPSPHHPNALKIQNLRGIPNQKRSPSSHCCARPHWNGVASTWH